MARFLLKVSEHYVYAYTEQLSKKSGFREISEEDANEIIENYGKIKTFRPVEKDQETKEIVVIPEPVIEKVSEKEESKIKDVDDMDAEILLIREMKSKNDVEKYMLEKFGKDCDRRQSLGNLKNEALKAYEESINGK